MEFHDLPLERPCFVLPKSIQLLICDKRSFYLSPLHLIRRPERRRSAGGMRFRSLAITMLRKGRMLHVSGFTLSAPWIAVGIYKACMPERM